MQMPRTIAVVLPRLIVGRVVLALCHFKKLTRGICTEPRHMCLGMEYAATLDSGQGGGSGGQVVRLSHECAPRHHRAVRSPAASLV